MKILAADDQPLVLSAIKQSLRGTDFELHFAKNGKEAMEKFEELHPDLVIVDLNIPGKNSFDMIQHIKKSKSNTTPVMVMSGESNEAIKLEAFNAGADEFIQRPIGLNELRIRTQKMLKQPINSTAYDSDNKSIQIIQKNMVGVVIPCYNEEARLNTKTFKNFVDSNLGYHLCFVNDGSKDNTLDVLKELSKGREEYISVYDCVQNGGKAEAVRQGVLHMIKDPQLNYIGYLDADLSTNFKDFDDLVQVISDSDFQIVGGSRINRMGADITKAGSRAIISKTINLMIRNILDMSFQDTQCGAKVMTREVAEQMFREQFKTSWLFDVEIFLRMKQYYGAEKAQKVICEQPLKRWVHEDGSKLSMKDSIKIIIQLLKIKTTRNRKVNFLDLPSIDLTTLYQTITKEEIPA